MTVANLAILHVGDTPGFQICGQWTSAEYTTTNDVTLIPGSEIDARPWRQISMAFVNTGAANAANVVFCGAFEEDFSNEVTIQTVSCNAGATKTREHPNLSNAAYRFFRLKAESAVDGDHTTLMAYITGWR